MDKLNQHLDNLLDVQTSEELNKSLLKASEIYNLDINDIIKRFYEKVENKCRDKLAEINDNNSTLYQAALRKSLEDWLNRFINDRQKTLALINKLESTIIKTPKIYTLYDLQQERNAIKIDYLVSEYVPRYCYILFASKPKKGKTALISNLIISLTTGKPWMDRTTSKSRVLFIQNEEPVETITIDRFESGLVDIQLNNPEFYEELIRSKQLIVAKDLDLVADMDAILKLVLDNSIDLVVIDSLSKSVSIKSGLTEYSQELFPKLNKWHEACHNLKFTSIIIHHTTKVESTKDGKVNPDAIAGSNHLLRNNDGYWILDSGKKEGEFTVYMVPRFAGEKRITFKRIEGEACFWDYEVVKESHLSPEELHLQNQVLKLLYTRWENWYNNSNDDRIFGYTLNELISATDTTRSNIIACTNRMLQTQAIEKYKQNSTFVYHFPRDGSSWMQIYLDREEEVNLLNELNNKNKQLLLTCSTTEQVNDMINQWSREQQLTIWTLLTENEKNKILLLRYPPKRNIGDTITVNGTEYSILSIKYDNIRKKHFYYYDDFNYVEE